MGETTLVEREVLIIDVIRGALEVRHTLIKFVGTGKGIALGDEI